jgi:hypothetical protein
MRRALALLVVIACGLAASATAAPGTKYLWATVNICNTPSSPYMMGVRGSMAGDGDRTRMYMRFTAQWFDEANQRWVGAGKSKWIYVGSGIYRAKQGGYTFAFDSTVRGTFRGVVDEKWTKHGRVVRTAHLLTRGGHPNTTGADPKEYSAALCEIHT